jgi:tRNA(Ile)-lysidine synthase
VSDQSNFDTTFFRNRLRHELLPHLENYNPRIRQNLLRMSQVNKDDYEVLQELVSHAWHAALVRQGDGYVAFHLPTFKNLPVSTQRYLLRKAIAYHLPSLRDIDFDSIERGIAFLCRDRKVGQVDLTAGLRLVKEQDTFWLATWQADLDGSEYPAVGEEGNLLLDIPSVLQLGNDWSMHAVEELDSVEAHQYYADNQDPFQAWLDVENLVLPLIVRIRKTGERFQPLGMEGHTLKVSDLMVNLKMPKRARPTWPLVCSGKDILWIPGYRQAHLGRVHPGSRRIIHLTLRKSSTS